MAAAKFGDDIPHIITRPDGSESWVIAGEPMPGLLALGEVQGAREDRAAAPPQHWSEIPTKTYVLKDRLGAMDEDGVDVQTFFPNIAGITNGTFQTIVDADFRMACIRAYNDWQAEEWYDFSRRFVPQCIFPLWDVAEAVAEVQRCHALGHRGI